MKKWNQIISLFLIGVLLCGCLAGCGKTEKEEPGVLVYNSLDELPEGYFVMRDGKYYEPYFGETTFDVPSTGDGSGTRVAWYGNDFNQIPTMYKGDTIVLKKKELFEEDIEIERFEDIGYTIGICNMFSRTSGRYGFSTYNQDFNVAMSSDAGTLCEWGEETAIIDKIGGVDLRAGNISRAGTVLGLEKNKIYNCDIYIGTYLHEYKIMADVRALVSMEAINMNGYVYDRTETITFKLPGNLQNGYYNINGYGIVRYLNDPKTKFSEDMDMNIPNDPEMLAGDDEEEQFKREELEDYTEDVIEESVTLNEDTTTEITVSYQENKDMEPPQVKLIGEDCAYSLSKNMKTENTLKGTFELGQGTYTIKIIGLQGRAYSYKVVKLSDNPDEVENQEITSGSKAQRTVPTTTGGTENVH